jgi:hypothetical protein
MQRISADLAVGVFHNMSGSANQWFIGLCLAVFALAVCFGIWSARGDRKARNQPLSVQEDLLVQKFEYRAIGVRPASVEVDTNRFALPRERIMEVGAEHGYEFESMVKQRMKFVLKGATR